MCDKCDSLGGPVEITAENESQMIEEVTTVAMHAASAYCNGWISGAKGLFMDMMRAWGEPALVRSAYVWGAARFFLPAPPGGFGEDIGHTQMAARLRRVTGEEPDAATVSRMVAARDQADAAIAAIADAASKGDHAAVERLISAIGDGDGEIRTALAVRLMGEAGARMNHTLSTGDERAMALYDAHVRAGLPQEDEDEEESGDDRRAG